MSWVLRFLTEITDHSVSDLRSQYSGGEIYSTLTMIYDPG